jgi:nicotinic acid mononucleotide adenylyltransferase
MRALFMEAEPTVISSTELRSLLKKGEGASFLAREVYAYILKNRLYGSGPSPTLFLSSLNPG